jgi:hypothetical protein
MEANELRIGNYVLIRGIVDKITEISISDSGTTKRQGFFNLDKGYVEPIPITPEILEKCGFEFIEEDYGWANGQHIIYQIHESFKINIFCSNDEDCEIEINYLHQLQNLCYALTGKELYYSP